MTHDIINSKTECRILQLFETNGADTLLYMEDELNRGRELADVEKEIEVQVISQWVAVDKEPVITNTRYVRLSRIRGEFFIAK